MASAGIVENDIGFAGLFKSVDNGATWTRLPAPEEEVKLAYRFWRMAEFGGGLFIAQSNARDGFWTLSQDWVLDRHDTDLFPDMLDANLRLTVSRAEKFHDSVLYSPGLERLPIRSDLLEVPLAPAYLAIDHFTAWWDKLRAAWPLVRRNLYRLDEAGEVSVVTLPNAPHVNDFTVIDGTVFVLGVSFHDGYYEATVLSSRDLEGWSELFRVKTPAMACSFAQLEGEWVLGLCADGMSDDNIASGQVLGVRTL